jgi:hypothetical protein
MLEDVCFDKTDERNFKLKVLVYKNTTSGDADVGGGDTESDSDVESVASDTSADGESDDEGPRAHPITGIDEREIGVEFIKIPYKELLEFDLFKDICQILGGKPPEELYPEAHFNFYNDENYDALYKVHNDDNYDALYKVHNDEILDMYEAVDTMMVGLPCEIIYSGDGPTE